MALFEVFIPTQEPDGFNVTTRIEAASWIQALRTGLRQLGDTADVTNIMVDIKENAIDVTEPATGRVFRLRELQETPQPAAATAPPPPAAPAAPPPAAPTTASPPPPAAKAGPPPAAPAVQASPLATQQPPRAASPVPPVSPAAPAQASPRVDGSVAVLERRQEKAVEIVAIGRGRQEQVDSVEDLLAELFELTQQLYEQPDLRQAASFVLDLAMRSVPAESGAVFISDINANDLFFAAARGPKADDVMSFRVPMGQGIVGFTAQEGVALAVSDVQRDPRFYARISQALGYETRSIACSPAQQGGRVYGALELINKTRGTWFTASEVSILNFLAHEFAEYLINTGQTGD